MDFQLRWLIKPVASCLHAGDVVRRGLVVADGAVSQSFADPVRQLDLALAAAHVDVNAFWEAAIPCVARADHQHGLVERCLAAYADASPPPASLDRVMSCVTALEQAAYAVWPRLSEELRLRERPIREQWESRGPGLLRQVARLTGSPWRVHGADVALVAPCLGGGGAAHPAYNLVHLEAVLANPWATLPEPVRLGWLLAQLGTADDVFTREHAGSGQRYGMLRSLATLPIVLEAAEFVEWTRGDGETLEQALGAWRPAAPPGLEQGDLAGLLIAWRRECVQHDYAWADAVRRLDQRLPS
jgi:hypothetical protein